jgi:hypothetical protein
MEGVSGLTSQSSTPKVVAFAVTPEQIECYLGEARQRKVQVKVIVMNPSLLPIADMLNRYHNDQNSLVAIVSYNDYRGLFDNEESYVRLAQFCLQTSDEFLSSVQELSGFVQKGVQMLQLARPFFQATQVWHLFLKIYQFEQFLRVEQPDEVWACSKDKWEYVARDPRIISLTEHLDYYAEEVETVQRVAHLLGIRFLRIQPPLTDTARYVFTRYFRGSLMLAFRQFQLARRKILKNEQNVFQGSDDASPLALALVRSPTHAARIVPVLEELSQRSWRTGIIEDYSLSLAQPITSLYQVPTIHLSAWQEVNLFRHHKAISTFRRWLYYNWQRLPEFSYRGIVVTDMLVKMLSQVSDRYLEAIPLIDAFDKIVALYKPSVLLFGNDQEVSSRCLICVCRQQGIPTLTLQHGMMFKPPLGYSPIFSDAIAVMGDMAADLLIKFGNPPEKLQVTGIPGFDLERTTTKRTVETDQYGAVTLITEPTSFCEHVVYPRFVKLAQSLPKCSFIVKVGPLESLSKYAATAPNLTTVGGQSLHAVLKRSRVVIGIFSTAILEAMQMGIPAFIVPVFSEIENPMEEVAESLSLDSDWAYEVSQLLSDEERCLMIAERQNRLVSYVFRQETGAAKRIASLISEMTNVHSAQA